MANSGQLDANSNSRLTLLTVLRVQSKYPMTVLKEEEPEKKKSFLPLCLLLHIIEIFLLFASVFD